MTGAGDKGAGAAGFVVNDAGHAALEGYRILDSQPEEAFDDLTRLAAQSCGVPIALISFVDSGRQWFKSKFGIDIAPTPLEFAFCAEAVRGDEVLLVPDAQADPHFSHNPLVTGAPYLRFYAGAPLRTPEGVGVGALCVLDLVPRTLTGKQVQALQALARQVMAELELRRHLVALKQERDFSAAVVNTVSSLVVVLDTEGRIVRFNSTCEQITGYSLEDVRGRVFWDLLLAPEDVTPVRETFEDVRSGHSPNKHENPWIARDGSRRLIAWSNTTLLGPDGQPQYIVATGTDVTERRRTEASLQRQNAYLASLHETTLALMHRRDLSDLLLTIVLRAADLVGTRHGYIYLKDPATGDLVLKVAVGVFSANVGFRLRPGEGLGGRILQSGRPLTVQDYDSWAGRAQGMAPGLFRTVIGVPLMSGEEVIGVIGVAEVERDRQFTSEEEAVILRFAQLASLALDNARLHSAAQAELAERKQAEIALRVAHDRLERRNRQLGDILSSGNLLRLNVSLDTVLQDIVDAARQSLGFDRIVLHLVEPDGWHLRVSAQAGLDPTSAGTIDEPPSAWDAVARLMQERFRVGRCYFIPAGAYDWEREAPGPAHEGEPEEASPGEAGVDRWAAADALFVPIDLRQGQVAGVLSLDRPVDGRRPTTETLQALEIYANQIGVAIENARLYDRLQHELDERRRAQTALEEAVAEAESANRAKSAFLANMSHELRTPLNAILGYSELIRDEAGDRGVLEVADDAMRVHAAGTQLLALISDVLDLSKIEAGRMVLNEDTLPLTVLVDSVATMVRPLLQKNNNTLVVHNQCEDDTIEADGAKVQQVLFNLLSNAAKFTTDGTITLTVVREPPHGEWVRFEVADTGIGMTQSQLGDLFQPFTQADATTTRKYGGTGLGLALSLQLCRIMGGNIMVASVPGQGTTFTVRLPSRGHPL